MEKGRRGMSDDKKQNPGEKPLDRMAYLKEVREELLVKLGLPKDTRPERVADLIKIKSHLDDMKKKRASHE
jgi:hypothetical protein